MKAFIHKVENGQDKLGTLNSMVTNKYKTIKNLIKHSLLNRQGKFHIEAFNNWNDRYKTPNIDLIVNV